MDSPGLSVLPKPILVPAQDVRRKLVIATARSFIIECGENCISFMNGVIFSITS
jgi:hypothetical protein